jgi:hypothetical protein
MEICLASLCGLSQLVASRKDATMAVQAEVAMFWCLGVSNGAKRRSKSLMRNTGPSTDTAIVAPLREIFLGHSLALPS